MTMALDLARWRVDPVGFVETFLINAETGKPFRLLPEEKQFLEWALKTDENGRLLFAELIYGAIRKSGKTTFAGIFTVTVILLFGGLFAEALICSNDFEQAQSRVFEMFKRIVIASPLLSKECVITASKIVFTSTNAFITVIASGEPAEAAGHQASLIVIDEPWGLVTERSMRRAEELTPVPTKQYSWRLSVSYAGFVGQSQFLERLYKRGKEQPEVAPSLHAGDGILMAWYTKPIAPWQTQSWLDAMRKTVRPAQYQRIYCNEWVSSEQAFVSLADWDRCVDEDYYRKHGNANNKQLPIWCGIDASVKYDSTAIVAVTYDAQAQQVRLVSHRIFQPSPEQPLDFEATIEASVLELHKWYSLQKCLYDPYQMVSSAQRLTRMGIPLEEFAQSSNNLTAASQCLSEQVRCNSLVVYPDPQLRLAISQAVAIETPRGWRVTKQNQSAKIDCVVALALAVYGAVQDKGEVKYDGDRLNAAFCDESPDDPGGRDAWRRQQMFDHVLRSGGYYSGIGSRIIDWSRW